LDEFNEETLQVIATLGLVDTGVENILNPIPMVNQKIDAKKGLSNNRFKRPKRHINICPIRRT